MLAEDGLAGSMGRRGNPYDNAKAESFMKTLKVEAVYETEYASFEEVAADLPRFLEKIYNERRLHSALGYRSPADFERQHAQEGVKAPAEACPAQGGHSTPPRPTAPTARQSSGLR